MKLKFAILFLLRQTLREQRGFAYGIISCTLLTILTPSILIAQTIDYGTTRRPQTCTAAGKSKKRSLTVEQAKMYFSCDEEWEDKGIGGSFPNKLHLLGDFNIKVAPRSRPFNGRDLKFNYHHGWTVLSMSTKPVYDIRGNFTQYICGEIDGRVFPAGKNCTVFKFTDSAGICFLDTFDEWHCRMSGNWDMLQGLPPFEK
jgi:hypothetical protein